MKTPFELRASAEHRGVAPGRSSLWAAIRVDPVGRPLETDRAPLALVLVVDTSGSMGGDPIAHVRASCELLADLLTERDHLAVVTFSGHAGVLHGLTRVDEAGRASLRAALRTLAVEGGTNMHGGLQVGAGLLVTAPAGLRRAMVLMSDGQPNVGLQSATDLAEFVVGLRPLGVSTLGFGLHHDENVLAAIATAGSGRYAYVPDPVTARVDLARAALAHGGIVADSLELTIDPAEGVELLRILPPVALRHGKAGASATIGDVFIDEGRLYTVELALDLAPGHRGRLATLSLRGRTPDGATHQASATIEVDVRAGDPVIDPVAQRDVVMVEAEAARLEARAHADRGAAPAAVTLLRRVIARIDGRPWFVANDGSPLAELREQLVDEATNYERAGNAAERSHQRKQAVGTKISSVAQSAAGPRVRPPVPAFLVGLTGPVAGQRIELWTENSIGRGSHNEILVADASLSRVHARVLALGDMFVLQDVGSSNGTLVNGQPVTTHALAPGDVVTLGKVELRFER